MNELINEWWILIMCWMSRDYERVDRPLRPENTPNVRDVIELEFRSCDEWIDKWIMNVEYLLNDE